MRYLLLFCIVSITSCETHGARYSEENNEAISRQGEPIARPLMHLRRVWEAREFQDSRIPASNPMQMIFENTGKIIFKTGFTWITNARWSYDSELEVLRISNLDISKASARVLLAHMSYEQTEGLVNPKSFSITKGEIEYVLNSKTKAIVFFGYIYFPK